MYPLLRHGDKLPTVAALQILLNRRQAEQISVDGDFGPRTRVALENFQTENRLSNTGEVNARTWEALTRGHSLQVIDSIDCTDPKKLNRKEYTAKDGTVKHLPSNVDLLENDGGNPIINFGMSNGRKHILNEIKRRGNRTPIVLLRFYGHGNPGYQQLASYKANYSSNIGGALSKAEYDTQMSSSFLHRELPKLVEEIRPLSNCFSEVGSIEFHGCKVGNGEAGRRFVTQMAQAFMRPVTAGIEYQYLSDYYTRGWGDYHIFHYEGPVFTACPFRASLRNWARSVSVTALPASRTP